jgi:hypothetical protein
MADQDQPAAPESLSIADRVAAQFGITDEPPEAAPEAPIPETVEAAPGEESPAEEFAEVEYEGARYQVPKALEKAILQQKDYTQKTQSVAERERQYAVLQEQGRLQALKQRFESEAEADITRLKAYDQVLSEKVEWESLDDQTAFRTQLQRNQWKEQRDELARALTQKHQQWVAEHDQALKDIRAKSLEVVSKAIPNWNDSLLAEIRTHGKQDGYTDVELQSIENDPRHVKTLYKAAQYDKLMASKAQAVQTANKAPPMVKPGATRPMPQSVKNDLALRKAQASATTSAEKARIIAQRLEGRF